MATDDEQQYGEDEAVELTGRERWLLRQLISSWINLTKFRTIFNKTARTERKELDEMASKLGGGPR